MALCLGELATEVAPGDQISIEIFQRKPSIAPRLLKIVAPMMWHPADGSALGLGIYTVGQQKLAGPGWAVIVI